VTSRSPINCAEDSCHHGRVRSCSQSIRMPSITAEHLWPTQSLIFKSRPSCVHCPHLRSGPLAFVHGQPRNWCFLWQVGKEERQNGGPSPGNREGTVPAVPIGSCGREILSPLTREWKDHTSNSPTAQLAQNYWCLECALDLGKPPKAQVTTAW
jgi:hypothetical protein